MSWGVLGIKNVYDKEEVLNVQPVVVGGGTDGASVNIGQHSSIKEDMQKALPWIFWSWCYAHHLELACKNGLVSGLFKSNFECTTCTKSLLRISLNR